MKINLLIFLWISFFTYVTGQQNVGVGIVSPLGKLHVKGSEDVTQFIIDAISGQTYANPLIRLRSSLGTDLMWINADIHKNIFIGVNSGRVNSNGLENTFIGSNAGYSNTYGLKNNAIGSEALYFNTSGDLNTALGHRALYSNMDGNNNVAAGNYTLDENTSGDNNTAIGSGTLGENKTGNDNTAIGSQALLYNQAGNNATAIGKGAMFYSNTTSTPFTNYNVAVGYEALRGSTFFFDNTGNSNTALGYQALIINSSGNYNTAVGRNALLNNDTGNNNVAIGFDAGGTQNTGSNCTFLGYSAEADAGSYTNAMAIGYQAVVEGSNEIRLGNSVISEIGGFDPWTDLSDGRYKKNVSQNVQGLDFILKLRPVTYNLEVNKLAAHLKEDEHLDQTGKKIYLAPDVITQQARDHKEQRQYSGFIAQEVESAANSIGYDFNGVVRPDNEDDLYGLQYSQFVVPLVKAIQELSEKNIAQEAINEKLKSENENLTARIERLEALLVSKSE